MIKFLGNMVGLFLVVGRCLATDVEVINQDKIKQQVQTAYPNMTVETVEKSPITGFYQLTSGPMILYASNDGRYLLAGDVLDLERNLEDRNITEEARKSARVAVLDRHLKEAIIYKAPAQKSQVTIFTDPDCGYCRELHKEIPQLLDLGIEVRYMAFPRQGVGSSTYTKMVSTWCTKDRKEAMDKIMQGVEIKATHCQNSIEDQLALGNKLGINGTPTIIFADGTIYGGYMSASSLARAAIKHNLKE